MPLNETPEIIDWPACRVVYVEEVGQFETSIIQAWQSLCKHRETIEAETSIVGTLSLYQYATEPKIFRAGFLVDVEPKTLLAGAHYLNFSGGRYARFTVIGSYSQLPEARERVFQICKEKNFAVRSDDWTLQHYANSPESPEAELITEILVPVD